MPLNYSFCTVERKTVHHFCAVLICLFLKSSYKHAKVLCIRSVHTSRSWLLLSCAICLLRRANTDTSVTFAVRTSLLSKAANERRKRKKSRKMYCRRIAKETCKSRNEPHALRRRRKRQKYDEKETRRYGSVGRFVISLRSFFSLV